jgi:hypothetical protein
MLRYGKESYLKMKRSKFRNDEMILEDRSFENSSGPPPPPTGGVRGLKNILSSQVNPVRLGQVRKAIKSSII